MTETNAETQTQLGKYATFGGKVKEPKRDRDSTRSPLESNLDPWGLPENQSPNKEYLFKG